MKINTVQSILFRQLRELRKQRRGNKSESHRYDKEGTSSSASSTLTPRNFFTTVRLLLHSLNERLSTYYQLCERTGLESFIATSRTIRLQTGEVMRLTRESHVKHLEVREGTVWLTSTPAQGDVLLHAGDCFDLDDNWPFVVQALNPAEITLQSESPLNNLKQWPRP